jgi:enoyl-CoA hydratase
MGGGVGLSSHGRHRIVTERTRLAMPETGIGYFPDIGATWLLPHMPGESGTWMALTGLDINAADAIHAGLADFYIPSARLEEAVRQVADLPAGSSSDDVDAALRQLSQQPGEGRLQANAAMIDRAFHFNSVEDIVSALAREEGEFAAETRRVMLTRSPTSLKLALRLLRAGRQSRTLAECLARELGACMHILLGADFYEGVRAAVIDKDRNPKWSPPTIALVNDEMIGRFFEPAKPPLAL